MFVFDVAPLNSSQPCCLSGCFPCLDDITTSCCSSTCVPWTLFSVFILCINVTYRLYRALIKKMVFSAYENLRLVFSKILKKWHIRSRTTIAASGPVYKCACFHPFPVLMRWTAYLTLRPKMGELSPMFSLKSTSSHWCFCPVPWPPFRVYIFYFLKYFISIDIFPADMSVMRCVPCTHAD